MNEQTGASEPLSGATIGQGAVKELSPTPAALARRRKRGKNWTKVEQYTTMDAYAKMTFDSDFIRSTLYSPPPFESALVETWRSSNYVPFPKVVRVYARSAVYTASLPVPSMAETRRRPATRSAKRSV
jgi:hypothetical protein